MGFLIRIALFLGLVILFIPADEAETKKLAPGETLSFFDTFGFATAAYADAQGFCGRNPRACATGGILIATFEAKARTGARWIYGYLDPQSAHIASNDASAQPQPAALPLSDHATLSTGSVQSRRQSMQTDVTSVTISSRPRGEFLPLPPLRRPS